MTKYPSNKQSYEAWFVSDQPNGYYELECQGCKHIYIYSDHLYDWNCRECNHPMHYPLGASW